MSELLMKLESNMLTSVDMRPSVLFIFDDKLVFHGNVGILGGQEVVLNYDQVAQVNHRKGMIEGELEILNTAGRDNIVIDHVSNMEGDKAKMLIDQQSNAFRSNNSVPSPPPPVTAPVDPPTMDTGIELLEDLAKLSDQGVLTEQEFVEKKRQILDRI